MNLIPDPSVALALVAAYVPPIVLIVEDELILRMRAVDIVEDAGFVAVEAVNADEALANPRRPVMDDAAQFITANARQPHQFIGPPNFSSKKIFSKSK